MRERDGRGGSGNGDMHQAPSWWEKVTSGVQRLGGLDAERSARSAPSASTTRPGAPPAAPAPSAAMKATTGQTAFEVSDELESLASAKIERKDARDASVRSVAGRTYRLEAGVWRDIDCPERVRAETIEIGSDAYFKLLQDHPELGAVLALGDRVVCQIEGRWYETRPSA